MPLNLDSWLQAFFLAMPRLIGITAFLPIFAAPTMPALVRYSLLLVLALVPLPLLQSQLVAASAPNPFVLLLLKETAIGLLLGFLLSLPFRVPAMIGDFLDNQRGAGIAQLFNPGAGGQTGPLGVLFAQTHITWFVVSGGLLLLYDFTLRSYAVLPLTQMLPDIGALGLVPFMALIGSLLGSLVQLALLLAAPAMIVMLVLELALGLMGRFAPQLNTFFLAMPLKSLAVAAFLLVYFAVMMGALTQQELLFAPAENALEALETLETN